MNKPGLPNMKPVHADSIDQAMLGPWFFMRRLVCSRGDLLEHLGPAHWTAPEDGLLYDYHYWVFEAGCGLRVCYSFSADGPPEGIISASLPEDHHLMRHDPWCLANSRLRDDENFEQEMQYLIRHHQSQYPMLAGLQACQVWRMGDDGNEMTVGFPTSEIDARCQVAELESHKHKQIYWIRRCPP